MNGFSRACPSGNHMIDGMRTHYVRCPECCGEKYMLLDKDGLIALLHERAFDTPWRKLMKIYRDWKAGKKLPCPYCGGKGEWEVWE